MIIVRPLPEVSRDIPNWLMLYQQGKLKEGAVAAESFSLYLDPTENQMRVSDSWQVGQHTVIFYIEEYVCWALASRAETVYSAYMKGLQIRVAGDYALRDMELVDEILQRFYEMTTEAGHDIASLMGGINV